MFLARAGTWTALSGGECTNHEAIALTVLFQVGMDKNIASLSVPLGQLKEEVLVSVCVWSNSPPQFCILVANK